MAITKIIPINKNLWYSVTYAANEKKTDLDGVIDYVINPNKSEQRLMQSCLNCSSLKSAYREMKETKERWDKTDGVLGYHFIQSFKPGEVTPEQAHAIGVQFAKECFGEDFEVVIGTHLDTKHLHNHIVINSVSCVDGKKYHSSPESYYNRIRLTSDRLCKENNLSVIDKPKGKGKHYGEWRAEKEGRPTIRGQLREELDEIIKISYTMKDFWRNLEQRGYEIKRRQGKYAHPSVLPPYGKYPIRFDGLGKGYSLDEIQERIIAARNGIKTATPTELKKAFDFDKAYKHIEPAKLKGFTALYYHYLYLFGKIQKKQTPQRVSFFMRDELVKFDRYQKQFKFLYEYNIETVADLTDHHSLTKVKIDELVNQRKALYAQRTDENKDEVKEKAAEINVALRLLRSELRMCENIYSDALIIEEKQKEANNLIKQAEMEVNENEHKRRSR